MVLLLLMRAALSKALARRVKHPPSLVGVLCGAGVGLAALLLYLRTLAPTVLYYDLPYLRDAAVLQVKAAILGVPDYTGYPTFVLLGKLFTLLPFGDIAYRANLSSAVYAALAVALVFFIGLKLSGRVMAAVAGAIAFAVGKTLWSQAIIAEVYTLNALFVSLTLLILLVWRERRGEPHSDRYLLLAAFMMGLSLTDHITSGLLIPFGVLFVLLVDRGKARQVGLILKGAGCFVVGLLPYAFIPIRTSMDYLPEGFKWGQPLLQQYPPNTFKGFYLLVSGGAWKGRMFAFGPLELPDRIGYYVAHLTDNFHIALLVVAGVGLWYLFFEDRAACALFGGLYAGWLFYALEYNIEDVHFYFIPTYLLLSLFLAVGVGAIMNAAREGVERFGARGGGVAATSLAVVALVLALWNVDGSYRQVDRSSDYRGQHMIETVVEDVKPNAAILHHRSPLNYMVLVEKRRTDISLVNYIENPEPAGIFKANRAKKKGRPVYILFPGSENTRYFLGIETAQNRYEKMGYDLVPVNEDLMLYEVVKADKPSGGSGQKTS